MRKLLRVFINLYYAVLVMGMPAAVSCDSDFDNLTENNQNTIGRFGAVWSDTLNFKYGDIITGPTGNVKTYFKEKYVSFDIEEIHEGLKEKFNTAKKSDSYTKVFGKFGNEENETTENNQSGKNIVIAALTIILKSNSEEGERFKAYTDLLKEGSSILTFVSGSKERKEKDKEENNKSEKENNNKTKENKTNQKTAKNNSTSKEPTFKFISSQTRTKNEYYYDPRHLVEAFDNRISSSNNKDLPDPNDKRGLKEVERCQEKWKKAPSNAYKALSKEKNWEDKDFLTSELDNVKREIMSSYGGSSIDSEQFLLQYLKNKKQNGNDATILLQITDDFSSLYNHFIGAHKGWVKDKIIACLEDDKQEDELLRQYKLYSSIKNHSEYEIQGYILNLHSTNEACCCCAYSIAHELLWDQEVFKQLTINIKPSSENPFFLILYSCSNKLNNNCGDRDHYERKGIGENNKLLDTYYEMSENKKYKYVDMSQINSSKDYFLQKHLQTPGHVGSRNTSNIKGQPAQRAPLPLELYND